MADSGLRRFNEVILLIARKNGKTTFVAGIDLAEFFLSRGGVDIVCASNTTEQANILFEEINNMREQSAALSKETRSKKNIYHIYSPKTKNKIKKLSAQSRNKDGYNIEVGCIDEVHEMTDSKVYDAIKQSQSTKKEPLIFIITTEGTTVGGFLDSKLDYARKMLKGEIEDNRVLPWLYTQDSTKEIYEDPITWQQADSGSWLSFDDLNNEDKYTIDDLRDTYAVGGVDLSSTTDLTAAVLVIQKRDSNKKYVIPHFFMPSEVVEKRIKEDNVPYDIWIKKGYITLTEGNQNDFSFVTQWFMKMIQTYGIRPLWVGYDPWNSQYWIKEMEDLGFNMEKVRQGIYSLSEPMKILEADLKNNLVNYNNNPILKWCLANTQAKVDLNGNIQPSKLNSKYKRIDGTVALIIAYVVLNRYKTDYENMI
jgi:phage terminase large subunit-like protein